MKHQNSRVLARLLLEPVETIVPIGRRSAVLTHNGEIGLNWRIGGTKWLRRHKDGSYWGEIQISANLWMTQ